MMNRWTVAVGGALALALLTLPAIRMISIKSFELLGRDVQAAPVCDAETRPAPMDYTLQDMNGDDLHLASLKGNVILINFWATWCGPCKIEIPGFVELQEAYGDQGFQVLGLSVDDTAEQIKMFAEQFAVNYPMLIGLGQEDFQEAYGPIWGLPISVWIDREGTLCKTHMGIASKEDFEEVLQNLL